MRSWLEVDELRDMTDAALLANNPHLILTPLDDALAVVTTPTCLLVIKHPSNRVSCFGGEMPASGAAFVTGRRFFFLPLMHGVLNWIGESDLGETTGGAT